MAKILKYDAKAIGNEVVAIRDGAQVASSIFNSGTIYSYAANGMAGYCTGYFYEDGNTLYVQMTNGGYAIVDSIYNPEWKFIASAYKPGTYSVSQAQALVNTIRKNNNAIIENNLLCARYISKFSTQEKQQIRALQQRVNARNQALIDQGLCNGIQTEKPAGYAELSAYLERLMADGAVGVATWVVVVIAVSVIAATATAAYFAYKNLAEESEKDVKFSKDLTRTLVSKLTEEEYQQLLDETKGIVTKARIKQAIGSYGNVLKIAVAAFAIFAGYKLYNEYVV